jgi:hypothetical protein
MMTSDKSAMISKAAIFLSGLFFGGAIDHVILAFAGRSDTPYGVPVGTFGNWVMATLDLLLTVVLWNAPRLLRQLRKP